MITLVCSILVSLVFIRGAMHKLRDLSGFIEAMGNYRLLPQALVIPAAATSIGLECLVPLLLAAPSLRRYGAMLAIALVLIYASAMAINLLRGRDAIDCGCGGNTSYISWFHVVRNIGLCIAPVLILCTGTANGGVSAGNALLALMVSFSAFVVLLIFDQLIGIHLHSIHSSHG